MPHARDRKLKTALEWRFERPGDFEDAQKTGASEHGDADRVQSPGVNHRRLGPAEDDDDEVEPVEHRAEVSLKSDRVHFDEHLERKQRDEEIVGDVYNSAAMPRISLYQQHDHVHIWNCMTQTCTATSTAIITLQQKLQQLLLWRYYTVI